MKLALLLGKMSLGSRPSVDLANFRGTPGMTGTDTGFVRIGEELERMGHTVERSYPDKPPSGHYDAAIAVNEPDLLRGVDATVRTCAFWLNDVTFCRAGFDRHCDLFFSPSESHREQMLTRKTWQRVEVSQQNPNGVEMYKPDPDKWIAVELGCDPERYLCQYGAETIEPIAKVPGRVVYCSSPDRGLHWLLQEWPAIRKAVPHANLHIFYTVQKWIDGLKGTPYPFPPIEALRARALYVENALKRLEGQGVTVRDAVSKETIELEMGRAECLAYPCDTIRWSEGFSCSLLEGCAARACPVTLETDCFPQVYGGVVPMVPREDIAGWRDLVVRALTDKAWRDEVNARVSAFATERTWRHTARKMSDAITTALAGKIEIQLRKDVVEWGNAAAVAMYGNQGAQQ